MLINMSKNKGFTIIEVIIVVVMMGILLTLGVVSLLGSQVQARDKAREGHIQTIAQNLEKYYTSGLNGSSDPLYRYPSTAMFSGGPIDLTLVDLDMKVLCDPSAASPCTSSFVPATNNNENPASVAPQPSSSNYVYVYQPLTRTGALCTGTNECIKFNLYYYKEADNSVVKIQSRNR